MKYIVGMVVFLIGLMGFGFVTQASEAGTTDCVCTAEYDPVCGVDDVTYGNACALGCAGVEKAYDGECDTTEPGIPSDCTSWFDGCNTCGVENGEATFCTKMACETYETPKCIAYEETKKPMIPDTCTSWFDGCNTCGVENGKLTFCTLKACSVYEEAYCNEYTFRFLHIVYQNMIDTTLDTYMNGLSSTEKEEKSEKVLVNIENKRDEINTILATSTFPAGSKELRSYSLILELLDYLEMKLQE